MITLGTTLLLAVALLLNNIQRQFPVYWWTPVDLRRPLMGDDIERVPKLEVAPTASSSVTNAIDDQRIIINKERIVVPDWIALDDDERATLEILHTKLINGCGGV